MAGKAVDFPMTTTEAAKYLRLSLDTVRQYVHRGLIQARDWADLGS